MLCRLLPVFVVLSASMATAQLNGTYTINPLAPPSPTNFASLGAATTALVAGVSGPVTFEIFDDGGPYMESFLFSGTNSPIALGNNTAALLLDQWAGVSATNRVTFRAAAGETPVIDATGNAVVVYWNGADFTTLEGLELRGAAFDAVCMYTGGTLNALNNTIDRCHIHSCGRVGVLTYGNSGAVNNTTIQNSFFHDLVTNSNGGGFSGFIRDGYISGRRDNNTRILYNTFLCNTMVAANGWILGNYPSGTNYTAFTQVEGNIFVKTAVLGTIFNYQTSGATVAPILPMISDRNCFWNPSNSAVAVVGALTAPTATYTNLASWQAAVSQDLNSFDGDPQLGLPGNAPHQISATSPCINLGLPIAGITQDFDGQPRDSFPDIGADERVTAMPQVIIVGTGCPGTGSLTPVLGTALTPFVGNLSFAVDVSMAPSNALAVLFLATQLAPAPIPIGGGCSVYLDFANLQALLASGFGPFPFTIGLGGVGTLPMPIPNQTFLFGLSVVLQVAVTDANAPLGYTLTNALNLILN